MTTSTRGPHVVPRSGLALLLSLVAIIVIGAIISAISGAVMIETRTGEVGRRQQQAFDIADAAAGEIVGDWESGVNNKMLVGATRTLTGSSPFGTGHYTATITRTNREIFLVDVTGRDRATQARQRLGILVKLRVLTFEAAAALTTRGPGRISGSSSISGVDHIPTGWSDCPAAGAPLAGIRHPNPTQLNFQGACRSASCVAGTPRVLTDATVDDETFLNYGETDWAGLAQNANVVLPGGFRSATPSATPAGLCDRASSTNWGEPLRVGGVAACYAYFPTIFFNGDTRIIGGRGQGILMINGDLDITGNFVFNGIIITRGSVRGGTGTPVITGGILAANVDLDNTVGFGNITLRFSRCAIQQVQRDGALGAGFRSRGWTQIF